MGDRAVMTFSKTLDPKAVGVYVHWIGDRACIEEILELCRARKYRTPNEDDLYAMARLIEATCERAGAKEPTGVGVGTLDELDCDNGDNGVYVIGGDWRIVRHKK